MSVVDFKGGLVSLRYLISFDLAVSSIWRGNVNYIFSCIILGGRMSTYARKQNIYCKVICYRKDSLKRINRYACCLRIKIEVKQKFLVFDLNKIGLYVFKIHHE